MEFIEFTVQARILAPKQYTGAQLVDLKNACRRQVFLELRVGDEIPVEPIAIDWETLQPKDSPKVT
jgi:hypothetical protein